MQSSTFNTPKNSFIFFAFAAQGEGISGSDRIFIELARRWGRTYPINLYLFEDGYRMCQRQKLAISNIKYQISRLRSAKPNFGGQAKIKWLRSIDFIFQYIARILEGIRIGFSLRLDSKFSTIVYSASEFWMDSLPAYILKMRYPKITWVAAWYQTAPNPLIGFKEGKRINTYRFNALLYFLAQLPIKPIISIFADFVIVNNESERKQFSKLNKKGKVIVLIGAVDLDLINKYKKQLQRLEKIYDAVFQGRFHPQKGVVELIDIWRMVVDQKPNATLAMVGDGPLMERVKLEIKNKKLQNNVKLLGFLFDGLEKYKIFQQSKIVVHSAFYDSGGMAAAEAMAFGLPCVGFDLESYKSYYPKGMVKVEIGNLKKYADNVLKLIQNKKVREIIGKEAKRAIFKNYSWEKRADEVFHKLLIN